MTNTTTFRRSAPAVNKKKRGKQPSAAAKQRIRDAFDADMLADICVRQDFTGYAHKVDLAPAQTGRERFFYYVDNGSDVLGIAHLDTVQDDTTCQVIDTAAGLLATSGGLDDRLGAYVILELLPQLDIKCDWLLTTDEEIGASTAADFWPEHKTYNWMFQFDRGGTDVVMYEYETDELVDLVEASTARVGQGIFSDICVLDHLGCAGFNWGVGYADYHSPRSHAWLEDTFRMVARFEKFWKANHDRFLEYDPDAKAEADDSWVNYREWWDKQDAKHDDDDIFTGTVWANGTIDPFDDMEDAL